MSLSDPFLPRGLWQSWELWSQGSALASTLGAGALARLPAPGRFQQQPGPASPLGPRTARVSIPGNTQFRKGAEALLSANRPASTLTQQLNEHKRFGSREPRGRQSGSAESPWGSPFPAVSLEEPPSWGKTLNSLQCAWKGQRSGGALSRASRQICCP